jgi:low temperature requirement protein LtrA
VTPTGATTESGKRVSWVELYLDLVFVLAIGELANLIIATPRLHTVWVTLGLFVVLWWTWVGFTTLYNRHGADGNAQRALYLAASIPVGAAAVALGAASRGQIAAFAVSLAATRVLLAVGNAHDDAPGSADGDDLRWRTVRAFASSAVLFIASIWVPQPFSYLLWSAAYLHESSVMFAGGDRLRRWANRRSTSGRSTGGRFTGRRSTGGRSTTRRSASAASRSTDAGAALDAQHFAERFGLLIIILLGEVVVQAGEAAADQRSPSAHTWLGLVAAMTLAAVYWWSYFAGAAEIDLKILRLSGGSPTVARAIFAAGHMIPAFALLMSAAGFGLLLREHPGPFAFWLACIGMGLYLGGTQASVRAGGRWRRAARVAASAVTYAFGVLHLVLSATAYLWLLAAWGATNVVLTAWIARRAAAPASAGEPTQELTATARDRRRELAG